VIGWTNVSASAPNAENYWVWVEGDGVTWRSESLPLTQTSIAFNADGTATGPLVSGRTYMVQVFIFDRTEDYAYRIHSFTMP
jgi:hypothetical protein